MHGGFQPPESERSLGLGFYLTRTPGFAGKLKRSPEDFRVQEISAHPSPDPAGPFTVLRVISRDWEQHELSRRIAREIGLAPGALRWAGTKDRRAVAERLASYRGAPPERPIEIPGVEIAETYRSKDGLVLGHLFGNAFDLRLSVRLEEQEFAAGQAAATLEELRVLGGFANLFGPQRFGEVRPVTHEVGRALVRGDVALAVETYLTAIPPGGDTVGVEARTSYRGHHDAVRALREFPPHFSFERQLLEHLARGHGADRALRALGRELRLLFVHAFQSLLFNRWVSARRAGGLSLREPEPGDMVLRVARDGTVSGESAVPVDESNLGEVRATVQRGGARLAGPLVGFETPVRPGRAGRLLEALLEEEGIERSGFRLPQTPELASRGSWRPVWVELPPVSIHPESDPARTPEEAGGVRLRFSLPKGSYATVLLREFLKPGAVPG